MDGQTDGWMDGLRLKIILPREQVSHLNFRWVKPFDQPQVTQKVLSELCIWE